MRLHCRIFSEDVFEYGNVSIVMPSQLIFMPSQFFHSHSARLHSRQSASSIPPRQSLKWPRSCAPSVSEVAALMLAVGNRRRTARSSSEFSRVNLLHLLIVGRSQQVSLHGGGMPQAVRPAVLSLDDRRFWVSAGHVESSIACGQPVRLTRREAFGPRSKVWLS